MQARNTCPAPVLLDRCFLPLRLFTGLSSCFSVDEYIAIAKEKHGYNMEQVMTWFSFVVQDGFYVKGGQFVANLLNCLCSVC